MITDGSRIVTTRVVVLVGVLGCSGVVVRVIGMMSQVVTDSVALLSGSVRSAIGIRPLRRHPLHRQQQHGEGQQQVQHTACLCR